MASIDRMESAECSSTGKLVSRGAPPPTGIGALWRRFFYLLMRALPPAATSFSSSIVTSEVSPRVVCNSAPCAVPRSTAFWGLTSSQLDALRKAYMNPDANPLTKTTDTLFMLLEFAHWLL